MNKSKASALSLLLALTCDSALAFTAIELSPDANYRYSKDANDLQQLTDGKRLAYPIWSKIESVGWESQSVVTMKFQLTDAERSKSKTIRFHTAVGLYAGVKPVSHIDVYTSTSPTGTFTHVGSYHMGDFTKTKESYSIDIPLVRQDQYLALVLHTASGGIFSDEVELVDGPTVAPTSPLITSVSVGGGTTTTSTPPAGAPPASASGGSSTPITLDQLVADSRDRIKKAFAAAELAAVIEAPTNSQQPLVVSTVDCYSPDLKDIKPLGAPLDIYQIPGLYLNGQLCIKVGNNTDARKTVKVEATGWQVSEIQRMIMRDGNGYYDPVVGIDPTAVAIEPRQSKLFWLDIADASKATAKPGPVNVISDQLKIAVPFTLKGKNCQHTPKNFGLTVWSYSQNQPIWKIKKNTVDKLLQSPVNTFTIHPVYLPALQAGAQWSAWQQSALLNEMNAYAPNAQKYFIVSGWKRGRDFNLGANKELDANSVNKLKIWIGQYAQFLASHNIPHDKVVLYLIDEPFGDKIDDLIALAKAIKQINPQVATYANPTNSIGNYATPAQLATLRPIIDFWQPEWEFVMDKGGTTFFQGLNKPWWIYQIPVPPSRIAPPAEFHRGLAWRGWSVNASGIGSWSFDATNGTTAWDDFDGPEADWALVYEAPSVGFTPSRRWFALMRGYEDIQLMNSASNSDQALKTKARSVSTFGLADMNTKFREFVAQCGPY